jgi:hypothetical protein
MPIDQIPDFLKKSGILKGILKYNGYSLELLNLNETI